MLQRPLKETGTSSSQPRRAKKHRSPIQILTAAERYIKSRIDELNDSIETSTTPTYVQDALTLLQDSIKAVAALKKAQSSASSTTSVSSITSATSSNTNEPWKFNHQNALSLPPERLNEIDWTQCVGAQRSDTGTDGVLFVSFQDHTAVCIKAPGAIAAEVYGSWLAKRLGVPTPAMRMVDRNGEEGQRIIAALMSPHICTTTTHKSRIERVLLRPFFIVMEYVRGIALDDVFQGIPFGVEFVQQKFANNGNNVNSSDAGDDGALLHDVGLLNCRVLGKVLALDVLTNNFDRLPCIWDNKGNPGNVMFQPAPKHTALCIDNMVSCIDLDKFQEQHQQYVKKASNMLQRLLPPSENTGSAGGAGGTGDVSGASSGELTTSNESESLKEFERVRLFLRDGTGGGGSGWPGLGVDIGATGTSEVQQGFLRCMLAFASVPRREFGDVKRALHEAMKDSLSEHNTWGLERVHPAFILRIADALHNVVDQSEELGGGGMTFNNNNDDDNDDESTTVPELDVIPPDSSLMPERNDITHRKLVSRRTQQQNIAALNTILSSSKTHETTPFVPEEEEENQQQQQQQQQQSDVPPRTPTRSPSRTTRDAYESIASPQLLRKLAGRDQKSEVCVVQ